MLGIEILNLDEPGATTLHPTKMVSEACIFSATHTKGNLLFHHDKK